VRAIRRSREGYGPTVSDHGRQQWTSAFVISCAAGVVGAVLLVAGVVTGVDGVVVAGVAGAAVSLGTALLWRSQLIESWRGERRRDGR
jgi:hypothetical protein